MERESSATFCPLGCTTTGPPREGEVASPEFLAGEDWTLIGPGAVLDLAGNISSSRSLQYQQ